MNGAGLDHLKLFLNVLQANATGRYDPNDPRVEFRITETFSVPGVGTVVSGTIMTGLFLFFDVFYF